MYCGTRESHVLLTIALGLGVPDEDDEPRSSHCGGRVCRQLGRLGMDSARVNVPEQLRVVAARPVNEYMRLFHSLLPSKDGRRRDWLVPQRCKGRLGNFSLFAGEEYRRLSCAMDGRMRPTTAITGMTRDAVSPTKDSEV
jgi:hypothetical protein